MRERDRLRVGHLATPMAKVGRGPDLQGVVQMFRKARALDKGVI